MNNYKKHQKLLKDVMLALQKKYPKARIFERHVGVFRLLRSSGIVRINKPGMADLWMLYNGKHYEFEIKSGKSKQTKDQKNWEKIVKDCGCNYFILRDLSDIESLEL